jgi:Lipoprotein LpqB beta-propeller domain
MPDRRRVLRAMLLGAAGVAVPSGLAAVAGCGVPAGGTPIVDGPGPSAGTGGLASGGVPPGPETAVSPEDLVQKFLLAAAGPLEDDYRLQLQDSARKFMTVPNAWSPEKDITVVRIVGQPTRRQGNTSAFVDVTLRPVGKLTQFGAVNPAALGTSLVSYHFEVVTVTNPDGRAGWRIKQVTSTPPNMVNALLLNSAALDDPSLALFAPQLVYFWPSSSRDSLVPDLRYLPLADTEPKQYTRIVNDLLSGPPDWLDATPLTDTKLVGRYVNQGKGGQLVVNLSLSSSLDPNRLMTQLRWSLWPRYHEEVQLQNNSQPLRAKGTGTDFFRANLAEVTRSGRPVTEEYCVAGGVVRPLRAETPAPPVLTNKLNSNVIWAALSRDKQMVAVVREAGKNRYGLWLGDQDAHTDYARAAGLPANTVNFGRPCWIPGQSRLLIVVDNRLYAVDATGPAATDVTPSGVQQVTAVAVAPDGRRIALIADRAPAVASLSAQSQATVVGAPQRFSADTFDPVSLSAIAWSRLDRVVLAGRAAGPGYGLMEITIDGAVARHFTDVNLADRITQLAAYPPLPSTLTQGTGGMGTVLGQVGPPGRNAYSFEYQRQLSRLPQVESGPSPAPSAGSSRPVALTPTAPFFAD